MTTFLGVYVRRTISEGATMQTHLHQGREITLRYMQSRQPHDQWLP